jgi:SAM-dependent methyltransferase
MATDAPVSSPRGSDPPTGLRHARKGTAMPTKGKPLVTNKEWKRWGDVDPLWGVATVRGKRRGESEAWQDSEFYRFGESDWSEFLRRWERFGVDKASCVEIGCGAGRITASLAHDFGKVHALDVAEGMLNYARPRVPDAEFHLTDGTRIPLGDATMTAAFSCHVLQHLESPEDAIPIFVEIHRVLAPNATLMIHLPIYSWPLGGRRISRALFEGLFRTRQWLARQKAVANRMRGAPLMRGTWYEIGWLSRVMTGLGFVDVEFLTFPVQSTGELHPFVLARKP